MPHAFAVAVELVTTSLAVAGLGYYWAAILAAFVFLGRKRAAPTEAFAPGVTILKSLKGLDPAMLDAFRSHCRQTYAGEYELLFGVSTADDPAVQAVAALQSQFPDHAIRVVVCPERLGTNGKVSTLIQLVPHARHDYLLINDSDITVSPRYLERVMAEMRGSEIKDQGPGIRDQGPASERQGSGIGKRRRHVGLVTALYRGRPHGSFWSKLEALGIATDFQPAVLLARWIEGGLRYGLGSTLAVSREALAAIGGLESLVDQLADDYELGARIYAAGYGVALCREVVETSVPDYSARGFFDHQVRWYRTVRDARPGGYAGLVFTFGLGWALLNVIASGISVWSVWLLALAFFLRLAVAMAVSANVLADHYVLPNLWLLPLRDLIAMVTWVAGFAGHAIVWRGERFEVSKGKLRSIKPS
ncbi:MAG TPA: glycosyltransferase [Terracidiphilus sp.]|jgi:ceramide glucosyltransferase